MSWKSFSTREMLAAIALIAIATGWYIDRTGLVADRIQLNDKLTTHELNARKISVRLDAVGRIGNWKDKKYAIRALLYSLGDPSNFVSHNADAQLRRLSGKSDGFGDLETSSDDERIKILNAWTEWYIADNLQNPFEN